MTRAERPDDNPMRQPKPSWGPGKNAALSFVAFAAIFGVFAYVERDVGVGHGDVTHDLSRLIGNTIGQYRHAIVTAASGASDAIGTATRSEPPATVAQAAPPAAAVSPTPTVSSYASAAATSAAPPATLAANPAPPYHATAKHARASHARPLTTAADTHSTPAHGRVRARPDDTHRTSRPAAFANARKPPDVTPRPQPFNDDAPRLQTASVTREELEGARALAKARWCAQISEWSCVEQNASRALAIDPRNSESRALLGQAIRNRL
ncbi:hypothetical protein [Burkholderia pseudomultivorans]|uniref:Uncharacterized protein n=1 Tax=Burkholderia pseudomultivorans TaxID=1207504 RepID=A0ABU2DZ69_9BURK|nr:hypothetical protein [Burkholderia pseudomultivorans]MDR8729255.1 hypothetical protein [Burkholderia pseudomultivorans]MDR8732634.1 hypothetical protein [Burkholderia pseudomultivorans]MDR8739500.1 hypothetical protein [Burkholderia pseudomultivorans]MDR8752882.1 hypothetical protein [Burkholderia pseudomultivorans]MDR8778169.1 hypothetical protein [Burkholderia pseudomultivorans]